MKHFSGFDNIFEIEAWYFWGNMVLLGHLDWELGTKGLHSDPADKNFLGLGIISNFFIYLFIYLFIFHLNLYLPLVYKKSRS